MARRPHAGRHHPRPNALRSRTLVVGHPVAADLAPAQPGRDPDPSLTASASSVTSGNCRSQRRSGPGVEPGRPCRLHDLTGLEDLSVRLSCAGFHRRRSTLRPSEIRVEQRGRFRLVPGIRWSVPVQGDRDACVPHLGAECFHVNAGGDRQARVGVPRIVEPKHRQLLRRPRLRCLSSRCVGVQRRCKPSPPRTARRCGCGDGAPPE